MPTVHILGTRGYPSFYGGFETAVRQLVPFLKRRGWKVTVYSRRDSVINDSFPDFNAGVAKYTPGIKGYRFSTLSYGFTSSIHAMYSKPDVVLIMNVANCIWLPILKIRKVRTVVNVDGIEWKRQKWGAVAKSIFLLGAKLTARYADLIITDSQEIQKYWKKKFGVASKFIPYGANIILESSEPFNFNFGNYFLYVARFVPENSISEFIESIPKLTKIADVVIVGSDDGKSNYDQQVRELCGKYSNVYWLGRIQDDALLQSLWQHCAIYIHGHTVGGTNPALVQAMGCGAVIIASDNVFNKETLDLNGVYFIDSDDLYLKAREIFSNQTLRQEISAKNKVRAQTYYDWAKICGDYEEALQSTIDKTKART